MTALDDRAVTTNDTAAGHLKLLRVLGGILLDPTLPQPAGWDHTVWPWGPKLTGYFHNDDATLATRRAQIRAYADAYGLTVGEARQGEQVRVEADGEYNGVPLTVWGLAPQDGSAS